MVLHVSDSTAYVHAFAHVHGGRDSIAQQLLVLDHVHFAIAHDRQYGVRACICAHTCVDARERNSALAWIVCACVCVCVCVCYV